MSIKTDLSDLIRALARRDWGTADRLTAELGRQGWAGGLQTIGAAFAIAVHRRFGSEASAADVARFVAEVRSQVPNGDELPALEMEGLIRAVLGEPELVDNISADLALGAQTFLLGALLQDENLTEQQLEGFIAEVEQTAARYL
ncbi:hypothetical protein [Micromonospora zhanjiangensis]|uniref:Tetracyclin repressor-like C-terminal domain-containing protein n=1 Tax=Micromonospora zhanjiangensis TaxID=1522057 RepID=A0ABV8KWX1_9ACTN